MESSTVFGNFDDHPFSSILALDDTEVVVLRADDSRQNLSQALSEDILQFLPEFPMTFVNQPPLEMGLQPPTDTVYRRTEQTPAATSSLPLRKPRE
jgi:hypothetical protein